VINITIYILRVLLPVDEGLQVDNNHFELIYFSYLLIKSEIMMTIPLSSFDKKESKNIIFSTFAV
jgi:hypothetical protein